MWHLVSPSYDSKDSIYTLTYWCTFVHNVGDTFMNIAPHCFSTLLHEVLCTYVCHVWKVFCAVYHTYVCSEMIEAHCTIPMVSIQTLATDDYVCRKVNHQISYLKACPHKCELDSTLKAN